jgi:hypothetical protein
LLTFASQCWLLLLAFAAGCNRGRNPSLLLLGATEAETPVCFATAAAARWRLLLLLVLLLVLVVVSVHLGAATSWRHLQF